MLRSCVLVLAAVLAASACAATPTIVERAGVDAPARVVIPAELTEEQIAAALTPARPVPTATPTPEYVQRAVVSESAEDPSTTSDDAGESASGAEETPASQPAGSATTQEPASEPQPTPMPEPTPEPTLAALVPAAARFVVGACHLMDGQSIGEQVPCLRAHQAEVMFTGSFAQDLSTPDVPTGIELARPFCDPVIDALGYFEIEGMTLRVHIPNPTNWERGDRSFACLLTFGVIVGEPIATIASQQQYVAAALKTQREIDFQAELERGVDAMLDGGFGGTSGN